MLLARMLLLVALSPLLAVSVFAQVNAVVSEILPPANYPAGTSHDSLDLGLAPCNLGTLPMASLTAGGQHPLLAVTLYQLSNGRLIQVAESWAHHDLLLLQSTCGATCIPSPTSNALGVGCSSPESAGRFGNPGFLGPRSDVNASNGSNPYPWSNPPIVDPADRRLKVPLSRLSTPNAQWIAEAQVIQFEDALANNDNDNSSYCLAEVQGSATDYTFSLSGQTVAGDPAIMAWAALDPSVQIERVEVPGPSGGEFIFGIRRRDNMDGTYHFECALLNHNAEAGAGSFTVSFAPGVAITNFGFHAPEHTNSAGPNNNPWIGTATSSGVMWTVDQNYSTNPNANGLTWGTTNSFWFDSSDPNPTGASIDFFTTPGSASFAAPVFPAPSWQVNQPGSSLTIDGLQNQAYTGPARVSLLGLSNHVLAIGGPSNQAYELLFTLTPGIANNLVSPGGQIVNLDVASVSLGSFFGGPQLLPGGGYTLNFAAPPINAFASFQMYNLNPGSSEGFSLSSLNEVTFDSPRIIVEGVGADTFNSDPGSGYWRVIHTGVDPAAITRVVLDFAGSPAPTSSYYFDTDQVLGSSDVFNLGTTYRNGSDVACGLDFSVSNPYPVSGFIATNPMPTANNYRTIEFQFTGGQFASKVYEFDADCDPGAVGPSEIAGLRFSISLDDGSTLTGSLQATGSQRVGISLY